MIMEKMIDGEDFNVVFQPEVKVIKCKGTLRLNDRETAYIKLVNLLESIADSDYDKIVLDLQELQFLNSLGIGTISKFVIRVRNRGESQLSVLGSRQIAWQSKLLRNLIRLMPSLESSLT
jgi:hypothetical protein